MSPHPPPKKSTKKVFNKSSGANKDSCHSNTAVAVMMLWRQWNEELFSCLTLHSTPSPDRNQSRGHKGSLFAQLNQPGVKQLYSSNYFHRHLPVSSVTSSTWHTSSLNLWLSRVRQPTSHHLPLMMWLWFPLAAPQPLLFSTKWKYVDIYASLNSSIYSKATEQVL